MAVTGRRRSPSPILTLAAVVATVAASACAGGTGVSSVPSAEAAAASVSAAPISAPVARAPASVTPRSSSGTLTPRSGTVPHFGHIYVIVMENKEYGSIVGSASAPYVNSLIRRYGLATRYFAVAHPSEPNYLALFSGSTHGIRDDGVHNLAGTNLADQIGATGRSWRIVAENVPLGCYKGATHYGGEDGAGWYARKHEPAISFTDVSGSARRCGYITDFRHFSPTAASFELIVPNLCHDMHDCSVRTGDAFLSRFVPRITASAAFADSALFITWDEGSTSLGGGGHVATLVISPRVTAGTVSSTSHNHYSLVRTIESAWGLGCLAKTCTANDLRELFH